MSHLVAGPIFQRGDESGFVDETQRHEHSPDRFAIRRLLGQCDIELVGRDQPPLHEESTEKLVPVRVLRCSGGITIEQRHHRGCWGRGDEQWARAFHLLTRAGTPVAQGRHYAHTLNS